MHKVPKKLGQGIAFYRPIDENTLLGIGNYVQVAVFEGVEMSLSGTNEFYRGDGVFAIASDQSEVNFTLNFTNMTVSVPDPGLISHYPPGSWSFFDLFGIIYEYQAGAYNLSTYQARAYHMGPSVINAKPEGQFLIRAYGGGRNRCVEIEFYRVVSSDFDFPLNKTSFWLMTINLHPLVNPGYAYAGPEGTVFTFRDFPQNIRNLGKGA